MNPKSCAILVMDAFLFFDLMLSTTVKKWKNPEQGKLGAFDWKPS